MRAPGQKSIEVNGRTLRKTVDAVAILVALAIALSTPLIYGLVAYRYEAASALFHAKLNADRVSVYIYEHGTMWQYQKIRLGELVETKDFPGAGANRILDAAGETVVAEAKLPARFHLTRSYSIVVGGATVGSIEHDAPLDPMLGRLGLVALLGLVLGFCAYLAVRIFPLRVLDRTLTHLAGANKTIHQKNADLQKQYGALLEREAALRSTEAILQHRSDQLVEAQHLGKIGDWSYRFGEATIAWAPELYDLLGYDRESFGCSHATVMAAYVGDGARRVLESQAEVIRTGESRGVDVKFRRGDGSIGDFVVKSKVLRNEKNLTVGFSGTIQDISDRKAAEEKLEKLAYYDPLTGLANRTLFGREIDDALTRCGRTGSPTALLLLDLDRFKEVNDSLGHAAGDELLEKIGRLISRKLENNHFLARLGGDEFAIIMPEFTDRSAVQKLAMELIAEISGPIMLERGEVNIGTSIGIATIPHDGTTQNDLQRNADLALYRAKEEGRGRFKFFEPGMSVAAQSKMAMARDLRRAVSENTGLAVHYQPQVEPVQRTGDRLRSVDPLDPSDAGQYSSRRIHSGRRELATDLRHRAVDHARSRRAGESLARRRRNAPRDCGQRIGRADLAQRFRRRRAWRAERNTPAAASAVPGAHGESARRSRRRSRPQRADRVEAPRRDARPGRLRDQLFVARLPHPVAVRQTQDRSHLHRRDRRIRTRARKLLQGIIALGRGLNMTIVAEGAEKIDEVEILRRFECDTVQGYVFARPAPAAEALAFARDLDAQDRSAADCETQA